MKKYHSISGVVCGLETEFKNLKDLISGNEECEKKIVEVDKHIDILRKNFYGSPDGFREAYNKFVNDFVKWGMTGIVLAPKGENKAADAMNESFSNMLVEGEKDGLANPSHWVKPNPKI